MGRAPRWRSCRGLGAIKTDVLWRRRRRRRRWRGRRQRTCAKALAEAAAETQRAVAISEARLGEARLQRQVASLRGELEGERARRKRQSRRRSDWSSS